MTHNRFFFKLLCLGFAVVIAFGASSLLATSVYADSHSDSHSNGDHSSGNHSGGDSHGSGGSDNHGHSDSPGNNTHGGNHSGGGDPHGGGSYTDLPEVPYAIVFPLGLILLTWLMYRRRVRLQ